MNVEDWVESRRGWSVDLSPVLATLRTKQGLAQVTVAVRVGVSAQTASDWEHDLGVSAARLPALAEIFGMTVQELTDGMSWRHTRRVPRVRRRQAEDDDTDEDAAARLFGAGMTSDRAPREVVGVCLACGENYPPGVRRCSRCHGSVLVEAA